MITPKLKLWLPVLCFASYVVVPLDKWIFLIKSVIGGDSCPDAEKYVTNLAFLIFYLGFLNVLLLALTSWIRLLFRPLLANFVIEIVTICVILYQSYPAISDVAQRWLDKNVEGGCVDHYVTESLRVHVYLILGYLAALFIRILLWRQTKLG